MTSIKEIKQQITTIEREILRLSSELKQKKQRLQELELVTENQLNLF